MPEQFDIKKLLSSPLTSMYWVKVVMFLLGSIVLVTITYAVYKAYIKKADPAQSVIAQTGSNVTLIQNNQRKRFFIPFIEGYAQQGSGGEKMETGIRSGLRFEF